jgi:hypothetical protein
MTPVAVKTTKVKTKSLHAACQNRSLNIGFRMLIHFKTVDFWLWNVSINISLWPMGESSKI